MKGDQSKPIIYRNGFENGVTCYTIKDKKGGKRRAAIIYVPDDQFNLEEESDDHRKGFKVGKGIDDGPKKKGLPIGRKR